LSTGVLREFIETDHYLCMIKKYSIIKTFNEEWRSMSDLALMEAMRDIAAECANICKSANQPK